MNKLKTLFWATSFAPDAPETGQTLPHAPDFSKQIKTATDESKNPAKRIEALKDLHEAYIKGPKLPEDVFLDTLIQIIAQGQHPQTFQNDADRDADAHIRRKALYKFYHHNEFLTAEHLPRLLETLSNAILTDRDPTVQYEAAAVLEHTAQYAPLACLPLVHDFIQNPILTRIRNEPIKLESLTINRITTSLRVLLSRLGPDPAIPPADPFPK